MARSRKKKAELLPQPAADAPLDSAALLAHAQPVLDMLTDDLLKRADASPAITRALKASHASEKSSDRTGESYAVWRRQTVVQIAAAWLLSCVFVRTLEDRGLLATTPNCTFLTTKDKLALQAAAIVRLTRQGFVEPVHARRSAFHILAHQIMALGIQRSGIARDEWWAWLAGASAFANISAEDRAAIVDHMLAEEILADQGGRLWLGPRGEKLYGRRNFAELYAVFSTPRLITVRWNASEIGTIDAQFLSGLDAKDGGGSFTLGGRPWQIQHVDWKKAMCVVEPATHAKNTRWSGAPQYLSYEICQAMREILVDDEHDPAWSKRMGEVITTLRAEHQFLRESRAPMIPVAGEITWWTWAGAAPT